MSADTIAKMVHDLQRGRFALAAPQCLPGEDQDDANNVTAEMARVGSAIARAGEVIDASTMVDEVHAFVAQQRKKQGTSEDITVSNVEATEGFILAPPWSTAVIGYDHGDTSGVIAMYHSTNIDLHSEWPVDDESLDDPIEWDRVKWIIMAMVFTTEVRDWVPELGITLFGPTAMWRVAVYDDGTAAYVWHKNIPGSGTSYVFDLMVLLNALNICNASNVYLDVPRRPRAVQRRIERTGVRVTEIHVRSVKTGYRGTKGAPLQPGTPLTSVRGHFAEYGPKYDKGLLFGRIEGRFWIPQHVRGDSACGTVEHSYTVTP